MEGETIQRENPARRAVGRPRRLTLSQVILAGIDIGLEKLSIGGVADRLGVGPTTIYNYVSGLDELRRLVAMALSERPKLHDRGQHWSEAVRSYADGVLSVIMAEPRLMSQMLEGAIRVEDHLAEIDAFLSFMAARGFTGEKAYSIYLASASIALGAAATTLVDKARRRLGETKALALAQNFADASPADLPHARSLGPILEEESFKRAFDMALEALIAQIAAERGETLSGKGYATGQARGDFGP